MTIEEVRDYAKDCRIPAERIDALVAELHPDKRGRLSLEESMQAIQSIRYAADTIENLRTLLKKRKRAMHDAKYVVEANGEVKMTGKMLDNSEQQYVVDYRAGYDFIMALQAELAGQHHDAEIGCLDYRVVKALAATYELQDYLANRIAQAVATGELEPDPED